MMRCPFLREAQVKQCQSSIYKKMIVRMPSETTNELCSSKEYIHCPSLKQLHEEHPSQSHCPFLHESLVQYCGASSVPKYVPHSESSIIRCGNDNHRYCELYLSIALPVQSEQQSGIRQEETSIDTMNEEIVIPKKLAFTTNHFWIDQGAEDIYHIGIDAFFTRIFNKIDGIRFITTKGDAMPTVVITVRGIDLQFIFPLPFTINAINSYLRATPEKLLSDPYGAGWLYEGTPVKNGSHSSQENLSPQFIRGKEATQWMKKEMLHLNEFIHNNIIPNHLSQHPTMADGGTISADIVCHLDQQELLQLFNEFFSPFVHWRTSSC
jgi:glycine cleavage system H lipoate-binding protein